MTLGTASHVTLCRRSWALGLETHESCLEGWSSLPFLQFYFPFLSLERVNHEFLHSMDSPTRWSDLSFPCRLQFFLPVHLFRDFLPGAQHISGPGLGFSHSNPALHLTLWYSFSFPWHPPGLGWSPVQVHSVYCLLGPMNPSLARVGRSSLVSVHTPYSDPATRQGIHSCSNFLA
jgi:hypothetical protein